MNCFRKTINPHIFIILYLSVLNCFSQSQNLRFNQITMEDGLSQNSVRCIIQDTKGFMWVGTYYGLEQYDGYKFIHFRHNPNIENSLSDNHISALLESKNGTIWVGTWNGLNALNPKTKKNTVYKNIIKDDKSISNNFVRCIYENKDGTIWIGTDKGLNKLVPDEKEEQRWSFIQYKQDSLKSGEIYFDNIRSIHEDHTGSLWIGTAGEGAFNFNIKTSQDKCLINFKNNPRDPYSLSSNNVNCIYQDSENTIWIGTENGLNQFDIPTGRFIVFKNKSNNPYSISNNKINTIFEDSKGSLWIATENGLNQFNRSNKRSTRLYHELHNPNSLSDNRIHSLYEDNAGLLWIGTWSGGINILETSKKKFVHYQYTQSKKNWLSANRVYSIFEDHAGIIWIGTAGGGVNKFDPVKERFEAFKNNPQNPKSIADNYIWTIYEDKYKNMWFGTSSGLSKFDRKKRQFKNYKNDSANPNSLGHNIVWDINEDKDGNLWIGTRLGGLNLYNRSTDNFIRYYYDPQNQFSIYQNPIQAIHEDMNGALLIGTGQGLLIFDRVNKHFSPTKDLKISKHCSIHHIFEDSKNRIWLGTDKGLVKFDHNNQSVFYTEKDGLPNDLIYCILEDDKGNLWLSTNNGIVKFNPATLSCNNYDVSDGLQSNEFNEGAYCKTKDGKMLFGGINGFNIFHPDSIYDNQYIPPVVITDFQIFNKSVPVQDEFNGQIILQNTVTETNKIVLSYKENVFSFEYAALNYLYPEKSQYSYKMEGLEKEWNFVGNRRFVTYTNLASGDYIFRVKGTNNDGIWNEEGASLKIVITPPFWQSIWFRGFTSIIIMIVLFATYKIRTHTIRKRNRELENRVEKRTLELRQKIKDHEKVEQALSQSEQSFRSLAENAFDGIIITTDNGKNLYANRKAAELTGYKLDELLNIDIEQLIPHHNIDKIIASTKEKMKTDSYESSLLKKNGEELHIEIAATNTVWQGISATLVFFRDISDRKRVEEEIQKTERLESVGLLAGGIAHDFNNRISIILGNAQIAKAVLTKGGNIQKYLDNIEEGTEQASALTQQLLTFSRGGSPIKKTVFIKETLMRSVEFSLSGSNVKCEFSIDDDLLAVEIDTGQIDQVIANFVINASQAMPDGGIINIYAENMNVNSSDPLPLQEGNYIKITIRDRGIGIPKSHLAKIFDPYFTTKSKGSGIGLTTAYSIIKNHDGLIQVESELGEGTTFQIYLPASEKQLKREDIIEDQIGYGKGKVLVMDDEELVREMAGDMLINLGYDVEYAKDGVEALRKYKETFENNNPFDVVMMDLTIPGSMGGKEAVQKLLAIDPNAKVIVSSGYSNDPIMADHIRYGFRGVIAKPYKLKELSNLLANVLNYTQVLQNE